MPPTDARSLVSLDAPFDPAQFSPQIPADAQPFKRQTNTKASVVWRYFVLSPSHPLNAFCIQPKCPCRSLLRGKGSTSNLWLHLKRHHANIYLSAIERQEQPTIIDALRSQKESPPVIPYSVAKHERVDRQLVRAFIHNAVPFNQIEDREWRLAFSELSDGRYTVPHRSRLAQLSEITYQDMHRLLTLDLVGARLSITTDSATIHQRQYMAVTAHYITKEWEMRDVTLAMMLMNESHTGEYVADLLESVLNNYAHRQQIIAAVTDNGANFVRAIKNLELTQRVDLQLCCAVHSLQLALKDHMKDKKPKAARAPPTAVRERRSRQEAEIADAAMAGSESVQHEDASSAASAAMQEESGESESTALGKLCQAVRTLVNAVRMSSVLTQKLDEAQLTDANLRGYSYRLVKDVETRFNSMCMVFERMLLLEQEVKAVCEDHRDSLRDKELTGLQWCEMKEYYEVMYQVRNVSVLLEASKAPSLGLAAGLICQLYSKLGTLYGVLTLAECKKFCKDVRESIMRRLLPQCRDDHSQIAFMLDPRIRTKQVELFDYNVALGKLKSAYAAWPQRDLCQPGSIVSDSEPIETDAAVIATVSPIHEPASKRQRMFVRDKEPLLVERQTPPIDPYSEITRYNDAAGIPLDGDALAWWKANELCYPRLAEMARHYLSMPASSAPSERVFSAANLIVTNRRRRLDPENISRLTVMKRNMLLYNMLLERERGIE